MKTERCGDRAGLVRLLKNGCGPHLLVVLLWGLGGPHLHAGSALAPAVGPRQLNSKDCVGTLQDQKAILHGAGAGAILSLHGPGGRWAVGKGGGQAAFRLAFAHPIAVGTVVIQVPFGAQHHLYRLAEGAAYPGRLNGDADWEAVPTRRSGTTLTAVLPAGTKTQALLLRFAGTGRMVAVERWVCLKERLLDLTPYALAQGEVGLLGTDPNAVVRGGRWQNVGPDKHGRVQRHRAIMSDHPAWFVLRWEEARSVSAMSFLSSIGAYKLYTLKEGVAADPSAAPRSAWRRIPVKEQKHLARGKKTVEVIRNLTFAPVTTKAVKLEILETVPSAQKMVWLEGLQTWSRLGAKEVPPPPQTDEPPPLSFAYTVAEDGEVVLAIDNAEGRRARNLFAQIERKAGTHTVHWDLKDEYGNWVAPGTYTWKGMVAPLPQLVYHFTPYPNVLQHSPENTPWNGRPQDGWLAEHGNMSSVCAVGDRVYMSAGGAEGGHAFLELGPDKSKVWGDPKPGGGLFTDGQTLYRDQRNVIERFDATTRKAKKLINIAPTPRRKGKLVGRAAYGGKVALAFHSPVPYLDNAATTGMVDQEKCLPLHRVSVERSDNYGIPITPRRNFLSLFRLGGHIAGDPRCLLYLETTRGSEPRQHILLPFKKPIALGSLVFPQPDGGDAKMRLFVLKADAPYPPRLKAKGDWVEFTPPAYGLWNCVPAPKNTLTRALRITFSKAEDELTEMAEAMGDDDDEDDPLGGVGGGGGEDLLGKRPAWAGRLEGMRLLRRRLTRVAAEPKVRVSSGVYNAKTDEWDAKRKEALTRESPGIYVLEWAKAQSVRGLAIKEIDGELTEIDIYTGPAGAIDIDATQHWEKVATYRQARRDWYQPNPKRNVAARYLDGMVDFGSEVETRAVRLRVVSQWTKHRRVEGQRVDRGGPEFQPARCRVYGVAALTYLGGEPEVDPRITQRLQIHDGKTGKLLSEDHWGFRGAIAYNRQGTLHAIDQDAVYQVEGDWQAAKQVIAGLEKPQLLDFDKAGNAYVYDHGETARVVRVFDPAGKALRVIGNPEPRQAGPYDPANLYEISSLSVSDQDDLWLIYPHENPRRGIHFKTDGTFVRDYLGNTNYGGGGELDPYNPGRLFYKDMVFELDWNTGMTRLRSMLSMNFEEASPWGRGAFRGAVDIIQVEGRTYLVSAPLSVRPYASVIAVFLLDDKTETMRMTAAFGQAGAWYPLKNDAVMASLKGRSLHELKFIWTDRNGDGAVQVEEVDFTRGGPKQDGWIYRLDRTLGAWSGKGRYEVKEYLADGTPVYHYREMDFEASYRLNDGRHFHMGTDPQLGGVNEVLDAKGERVWAYKAQHGMQGLFVPPWQPGVVDLQQGISGHAVAEEGEIGEFVVIKANNGQMNLWTMDGLLASHLTLHKGDRRATYFPAENERGTRLDPLHLGQEHFHHYFCKTVDGRYFIVVGHNHISVVEVKGFERFKRIGGTLEVTPALLEKTRAWDARQARKKVLAQARVLVCRELAEVPKLLAKDDPKKLGGTPANLDLGQGAAARFHMATHGEVLYLSWIVNGYGPFQNRGDDHNRYFKTGAAVDFKIATNPAADPERQRPTGGDLRLLIVPAKSKPVAVLYRAFAPGAPVSEAWETTTVAGGTTRFESVRILSGAKIVTRRTEQGYVVDAAIPLSALGLEVAKDMVCRMDWGVLGTEKGHSTTMRNYWSNFRATGVSDEPTEARLVPSLWGSVRFAGSKKQGGGLGVGNDDVVSEEELLEELEMD